MVYLAACNRIPEFSSCDAGTHDVLPLPRELFSNWTALKPPGGGTWFFEGPDKWVAPNLERTPTLKKNRTDGWHLTGSNDPDDTGLVGDASLFEVWS